MDYRGEPRRVQNALCDDRCSFLVCFNGFGSELSLADHAPGELVSAFGYYRKVLFDLMHDCPSHERMAHQMRALDNSRQVLLTDYGYVQEAQELGFPNVRFVPSITFPLTVPTAMRTAARRLIPVLLPLQHPPRASMDIRFDRTGGYRHRIFLEIYEAVTARCVADLSADPRVEVRRACREAGIRFEVHDADHRFLLTRILDGTKYARRGELVQALKGLPVTIVTDARDCDVLEGHSIAPPRSFRELLALMAEASCVLCPLPHMTGFHERALGAFTAGAAVVAAPNDILETRFRHAQDVLVYRSTTELAELLPGLLAEPDRLQAIARSGQDAALDQFAPHRLAETMLSILHVQQIRHPR